MSAIKPVGAVLVRCETREGVMFYSEDSLPDPTTLKDRFELVPVYTITPAQLATLNRSTSDVEQAGTEAALQKIADFGQLQALVEERDALRAENERLRIKAALFDFAVRKGLLTVHSERIHERDPGTRCSWLEGHAKACDISNDAARAAQGEGK